MDPALPDADDTVILKFKMTSAQFLTIHAPIDPMFTSFMSLCQIDSDGQTSLLQYDGLHLLPDHDHLLAIGAARVDDGKVIVEAGREVYADFPVPSGGYSVAAGYNLLAVFRERNINVTLSDELSTGDPAVIDARPCGFHDLDLSDMGWKWDGTACELEIFQGHAFLVDRAGRQRMGVVDFDGHICLHLEELTDCYVLLRIMAHRGMVPPHCGFTLRTYAERVRLKINGKPVCGPPTWRAGRKPELAVYDSGGVERTFHPAVDGVISRHEGRDYYCKYQWTIDIRDTTIDKVKQKLATQGLGVDIDVRVGLWEYGINRTEAVVEMRPIRQRNDKRKETTMETIIYLLNRATLSEMQVLSA